MSGGRAPALFGPPGPWLWDRRTDLMAFGGSALASLLLLAYGLATGIAEDDTSPLFWLLLVLGLDVAHVWSTLFRLYLDPAALRRHRALSVGAPLAAYALCALAYQVSFAFFWRCIAYAATYHFVRQQLGFLRLYQSRDAPPSARAKHTEAALIVASMVVPLAIWHAGLPRSIAWMVEGDYVAFSWPGWAIPALEGVYALLGLAWLVDIARAPRFPSGRALLVTTTAAMWWLGIVTFDGDFAFTVTNVILHAVPYLVLVGRYRASRAPRFAPGPLASIAVVHAVALLCAFAEETGWDIWVWGDHARFFGAHRPLEGIAAALVVPLLATPQVAHYLLDGFVWKRGRLSDE